MSLLIFTREDKFVVAGLEFKELVNRESIDNVGVVKELMNPALQLEKINLETRTAVLKKQGSSGISCKHVFIELKHFELRRRATEPSETVKNAVKRLGSLLGHPKAREAGFRTLQCIALVKLQKPQPAFAFAFKLEEELFFSAGETVPPTSLLQAIQSRSTERPTLEQRFAIARSLVKTVFHLHSVDWLHKSIRSENVIFGYHSNYNCAKGESRLFLVDYEKPFLVGFEFSREERDKSTTDQDDNIERNIYRHPDRQGQPENRFNSLHDIYALGVVLLEIGLWRPAIGFEEDYSHMQPEEIMKCLQDHARDRLPHYMGVDYCDAVLACLDGNLIAVSAITHTGIQIGLDDEQRLKLNLNFLDKVLGRIYWREDGA